MRAALQKARWRRAFIIKRRWRLSKQAHLSWLTSRSGIQCYLQHGRVGLDGSWPTQGTARLESILKGRRRPAYVSPLRLDFVLQTPLHYSGMPLDFMTSHVGMGPNCKTRIALLCYPVRQRRLITSQGCQYATALLDYRCVEYVPYDVLHT